jgi:hypothetical protein
MSGFNKETEVDRVSISAAPSRPTAIHSSTQADLEKVYSLHEDKDVAFEVQQETDPNVVNWDGPDDPENPLNWTPRKKWGNIAIVAAITFLT